MLRKADGDAIYRVQAELNFLARFDRKRQHYGTCDDDLSGSQRFAECRKHVGYITNNANQFAWHRLHIGRIRDFDSIS